MKLVLAVVALLSAPLPAMADFDCGQLGSSTILKVTDWSLIGDHKVSVTLLNRDPVGTKMVDGEAIFADALDRVIGRAELPPDLPLAPIKTATVAIDLSDETPRLAVLPKSDITATACVGAVTYEDGSTFILRQRPH